jgi:hypothetical protein
MKLNLSRSFGLPVCVGIVSFLLCNVFAQPCAPSPSGLVGWWRAEGNANDSASTNQGTLQSGVTFAPGEAGQAFSFDGVNGRIDVPDAPALNPSAITLEAWIKPSAIKLGSRIISKDLSTNTCTDPYVVFDLDARGEAGGRVQFAFTSADNVLHTLVGTSVIPTTGFTHVAATYDGSVARVFFNGVLENSLAVSGNLATSTAPVVIGNAGASCRASNGGLVEFAGLIDELSMYNRALTTNEVLAIFSAGGAGKCGLRIDSLKMAGEGFRVLWPTGFVGFVVETNADLSFPAGWSIIPWTPNVSGPNFFLDLNRTEPELFFRLRSR